MRLSVTMILIAVNAVIFFASPLLDQYSQILYFTPATAFETPWTFVTSVFIHANIVHLLFNMFTLLIFGSLLEARLGPRVFILFYLAAGIVGNFAYMGMAYSGLFPSLSAGIDPTLIPGIGASGAIMGVMGVLGVLTPRLTIYAPMIPVPVPMFIGVILFAIFNIGLSFVPSGIGTGAHLGGLVSGVLFGLWLRHYVKARETQMRIRHTYG